MGHDLRNGQVEQLSRGHRINPPNLQFHLISRLSGTGLPVTGGDCMVGGYKYYRRVEFGSHDGAGDVRQDGLASRQFGGAVGHYHRDL